MSVKLMRQVMMRLSERPMSMKELAEKTGIEEKQVYRVLSTLHNNRRIVHIRDDDGVRRYRPRLPSEGE